MKSILFAIVTAACCWPQGGGPLTIGLGPGYVRYNDNTNNNFMAGDTWHFSAYTAAGNRFGTWNDGWLNAFGSFANLAVVKLASIDYASANNTSIQLWSHSTFQTAYTLTTGAAPNCTGGSTCDVKSYMPFAMAGCVYLPVFLQGGSLGASHSTIIKSCDIDSGTPRWVNPAHVGGTALLNGDPPAWNAVTPGSDIMFPSTAGQVNKLARVIVVQPANWQDDGSHCPAIPASAGGDGSGNYAYFFAESSDVLNLYGPYRVSCANLPNLNASQWEAWNGTAWTSTLSTAKVAAKLGWWTNSGYGAAGALGTSPAITYLPGLETFVLLGQHCLQCGTGYNPTVLMAQTTSLTGAWSQNRVSGAWLNVFQYGTNPLANKLSGALNAGVTAVTVTKSYDAMVEAPVPFVMTVDSEQMLVTAAGGTSRTVVRGYGGTSDTAHADASAVIGPYTLRPQLVSFVQGDYSYANGVATVGLAFEGDGLADSGTTPNNAQLKAHNVYGPYFTRATFRNAAGTLGANYAGNVPLRFSMGAAGLAAAPRRGLVWAADFFDHAGYAFGAYSQQINLVSPRDLVSGVTCTPAVAQFSGGTMGWNVFGLSFSGNDVSRQQRCESASNFPISGDNGWTQTIVFRSNTVTPGQGIFNIGGKTNGHLFAMYVGLGGSGAISGEWWNAGFRSPAGAVTANTWYVFTITKSPGPINTTTTMYLNGSLLAPAAGASTTIPTINTSPVRYGLDGNSSEGFLDFWNGTLAGHFAWNRVLSATEVTQTCRALRAAYVRRGIALTCN